MAKTEVKYIPPAAFSNLQDGWKEPHGNTRNTENTTARKAA